MLEIAKINKAKKSPLIRLIEKNSRYLQYRYGPKKSAVNLRAEEGTAF